MKTKSSLKVLMNYAGKYRYLTYMSWILSGLSAVFALIPFYYIWKIIKEVLYVMPNFAEATGVVNSGIKAVLFALLSMVVYIIGLMCSHLSAFRVQANIRKSLMRHILTLPLGSIEQFGSGKVRKIVNECSEATETYLAHQLPDMVAAYVTPIAILVILFGFDPIFGLLCIIPEILVLIVMFTKMTGPTLKIKMQEYQNALDNMSNEAVEYVRGIPVVKTFGQTVYSFERFKKSIDNYSEWVIAYTKDMRLPMCFITMLINGVFAFIMLGGMWFLRKGMDSDLILNIIFYIIISPILTVIMNKIMFQSENKMIVEDSIKRINSILELNSLQSYGDEVPKDNSITLKNVSYSYVNDKKALDNISIDIKPNTTVAFVGPSGGGKTTLANVISRFFDVDSGEVLIGGANIKNIDKTRLMETVSFVFQNNRLIKGSILDNVKIGKNDASIDEVMLALKKAQCLDIIEKLPNGVNTTIGSEGIYLSGGEQQRIGIAAAILKNTPIVILDEATAFADPDNESKVRLAFKELAQNKTVIMIAHRLSTVKDTDFIYVIKDGKVDESGKYDELINKNGTFAKMMNSYTSSVEWKISKEGL